MGKRTKKTHNCCTAASALFIAAGLLSATWTAPVMAAAAVPGDPATDTVSEADMAALEQELAALEAKLAKSEKKTETKKANIDKRLKRLAVNGDFRVHYENGTEAGGKFKERARVKLYTDITPQLSFTTRWALMENNEFGLTNRYAHKINVKNTDMTLGKTVYPDLSANDNAWVSDAYLKAKNVLGARNLDLVLGRFGQTFGATGFWSDADAYGGIDGVKLNYLDPVTKSRLTFGYANFGANLEYNSTTDVVTGTKDDFYGGDIYRVKPIRRAFFVDGAVPLGRAVTLHGMLLKEVNGSSVHHETGDSYIPYYDEMQNNYDLRGVGITAKLGKNFTLLGDYMVNTAPHNIYLANGTTDGYECKNYGNQEAKYISLRYKGAKWGEKGSFGINLDWRDIAAANRSCTAITDSNDCVMNSILYNPYSINDDVLVSDGIRGPVIGFKYMLTKDIMLQLMQTLNNKVRSNDVSTWTTGGKDYASVDMNTEDASNYTFVSLSTRF